MKFFLLHSDSNLYTHIFILDPKGNRVDFLSALSGLLDCIVSNLFQSQVESLNQ